MKWCAATGQHTCDPQDRQNDDACRDEQFDGVVDPFNPTNDVEDDSDDDEPCEEHDVRVVHAGKYPLSLEPYLQVMKLTKRQAASLNEILLEEVQSVLRTRRMPESLLEEEYLHGVPEWQLREDSANFVKVIRKRIETFILLNKSENNKDQTEAIAAANAVCDELEDKVYGVLEDALFNFVRRV